MINPQDVIDCIEKIHNVKLYEYQKELVEYIVKSRNYSILYPRNFGRKLYYVRYLSYLKSLGYETSMVVVDENVSEE